MSQVAGVIQWVGYDGVMDEDEERQVCEEVQQIEGAKATELTPDLFLMLLTDPPCLQFHEQLFSTDTTLWCLGALSLALQQEQEQLLQNKSTGTVIMQELPIIWSMHFTPDVISGSILWLYIMC